jgi:hypothetical protein
MVTPYFAIDYANLLILDSLCNIIELFSLSLYKLSAHSNC